jgi:hypothetical protein
MYITAAWDSEFSLISEEQLALGKERYEHYKRESKMPRYSKCWTDALKNLEFGCQQLTDDLQYRLALEFANCFSLKTGRPIFDCSMEQNIEECVKDMGDQSYGTFREFFTHTQNMCFFLQSQAWQAETDQTIVRLADNSQVVAQQLADSSELQEVMMKKQNESLKNQEVMIQRGMELRNTIEESAVDVNKMLKEFKDSTSEQRTMIFEVFDRVKSLQKLVMGEFTGFYSLIFYTVSILICYMLTSTPRTSGARFWLFTVMTANIVIERLICWGTTESVGGDSIVETENYVYKRLWWCRKIFSSVAVGTWIWFAIHYRDYNKINNQLLNDIKKQNSDLKHLLQSSSVNNHNNSSVISHRNMPPLLPSPVGTTIKGMDTSFNDDADGNRGSISGYYTDTESSSSESVATDYTFTTDRYGDFSDDSDADLSVVGRGSRESTPALLEELRHLRESTPFKEMELNQNSFSSPNVASTPKKKAGRPKGSKNRKSLNVSTDERPGLSHYNLRRRTPAPSIHNPVVNSESADDFGKTVKHLARVAMRNNMMTRVTLERRHGMTGGPNCFSSDDD